MTMRIALLLSLSLLSACATYSGGRGIPAPVESRDNSIPTQNQSQGQAQSLPSAQSAGSSISTPIGRQEIPNAQQLPVDSGTPAPRTEVEPATASSTLLQGVDSAIAQGDLERAAALCERALRISPRDAMLWYRLASVRAQQGRNNEAQGFAQRALSYANGDQGLQAQIQSLLRSL